MANRSKVKITVIRKLDRKEIFGQQIPEGVDVNSDSSCTAVEEGQEFIIKEDGGMPQGFCTWAWHDIYPEITTLRLGGNFPWINKEGLVYSSCSDGLRPVIFKVERISS